MDRGGGPAGIRRVDEVRLLGRLRDELRRSDRHQLDLEHGGVLGHPRRQRQVGGQLLVVHDATGHGLGDPVELVEQHAGVGRPLVAVAGGGPGDQRVDVRRDAGDGLGRRGHVLVDVLVGDGDR